MTNRKKLRKMNAVDLAKNIKALSGFSIQAIVQWLRQEAGEETTNETTVDMVNHPPHYDGQIECIDAMIQQFGVKEVMIFCKINAFKYIWRTNMKNGNEDMQKAEWYVEKYNSLSGK